MTSQNVLLKIVITTKLSVPQRDLISSLRTLLQYRNIHTLLRAFRRPCRRSLLKETIVSTINTFFFIFNPDVFHRVISCGDYADHYEVFAPRDKHYNRTSGAIT